MATTTAAAATRVNPRDSMKSTWRTLDKAQWSFFHWMYEISDVYPNYLDREPPKHAKTDKVPFLPESAMHFFILSRALTPLALHQAYTWYTGNDLHPVLAVVLYTFAYKFIHINQFHVMRRMGYKYGFFDGDKHSRDEVPDHSVGRVMMSLLMTATFRTILLVSLSYTPSKAPITLLGDWKGLLAELALYGVVLDFWFYWYHRVMHQYDGLWKFHRTHHLTKHPNALLTLYADEEQEFFDIIGIPLLTFVTMKLIGCPMGFYDWWICQMYITFTELYGHSGVRIVATTPSPITWLLRIFEMELIVEDHDLHHRKGWRKSHNYGKQTRVWDRLFGTCADRIESTKNNIDYDNPAFMPLI